MMRAFLTFTSANKHILLALGSDGTGRDDFEISQVGGSVQGVSNRWNGIWNRTVEWKMEWNGECT